MQADLLARGKTQGATRFWNCELEQDKCLIHWSARGQFRRETQNMHSRPRPIAHALASPLSLQPEHMFQMHLCSPQPAELDQHAFMMHILVKPAFKHHWWKCSNSLAGYL